MKARQAVITEPFQVGIREVDLPDPGPQQILVRTEASAISPGTELAVYTGTHQWLLDPKLPDWKFPFRPGYSAAGTVVAVGGEVSGVHTLDTKNSNVPLFETCDEVRDGGLAKLDR